MKPWWPESGSVLDAWHRSALHRPQGTQRGLLRLGQSPDPCDIEALIGSIPSQRLQMLATVQVPERDGPIIPAAGQPAPIGTHLERLDCPLMRLLIPVPQTGFPHALPAVDLPPAQPPVTASTDKPLPARIPGHRSNHPRMPFKGVHELPAVGIPHEELPTVALPLATTNRGQPRPVRTPGHAHDGPMMPRQLQELRAIGGVPHIDVAIFAPTNQARAIGTPGHSTDPGHVCTTCQPWVTPGHVPHQHTLLVGSAG